MTKKLLAKKRDGAENGVTTRTAYAEYVGENEKPREQPADMLASETQSSKGIYESGNEPKSVLLAMAWTAIETLLARGDARIYVGNDRVMIVFVGTELSDTDGLVPTVLKESETK